MISKKSTRPMPEAAFELELFRRAKRREEAAIFALYELHKARVYTICLRITAQEKEAEHLTSKAFVHTFRQILSLNTETDFAAALRQFAVREAMAGNRARTCAERFASGQRSSKAKCLRTSATTCESNASAGRQLERQSAQRFLQFDTRPSLWN
ncbi:MAG: RNA polymerase sigma factor [Terriglobia bacterium]